MDVESANIVSTGGYDDIQKVIRYYDLIIKNIDEKDGMHVLNTNNGPLCIYRTKHSKERIKREFAISEYLITHGFENVMKYYKTMDGRMFTKDKGLYYYIAQFADVRECSIQDIDEVQNCIILLANFHKAAFGKDVGKIGIDSKKAKHLPSIYAKWLGRLLKYGRLIDSWKLKSEYDNLYRKSIESFYSDGARSINLLKLSDYDGVVRKAKRENHICHGSFYYHDVLIDKSGSLYISGLDDAAIDVRMRDLGRFLRKMLSRGEYCWDFSTARKVIEAYSSIIPLNKYELMITLSIIIFPYDFYKLGKRVYEKHNIMNSERYTEKLGKAVDQIKPRQEFINEFMEWANITAQKRN